MKHIGPFLLTLLCIGTLVAAPLPAASQNVSPPPAQAQTGTSPGKPQPPKSAASPKALEGQFVTFKPNFPLMPKSLNLFGYERDKATYGWPVFSPDRTRMAVAEVFFQPATYQTISRVSIIPVGKQPELSEVMPESTLQQVEFEKQMKQASDPTFTPQVDLKDINPEPIWDRYRPEKQAVRRQVIFQSGFDDTQSYRTDIIQVADWSEDGGRLLMVYRPSVHHMGVWRTVPVVYDFHMQELVKLTHVPHLVWQEQLKRLPDLRKDSARVWDIRPLGWHRSAPNEVIVKLVIFEGQSEIPVSIWSYSLNSGLVHFLGDTIDPELVARNGWLVSFTDPTAPGGPVTYETGKAPPPRPPESAKEKRKRERVPFWKK